MALTVLYPEALYPDDSVERAIYGPEARVVFAGVNEIAELSDAQAAEADGVMTLHLAIPGAQIARFPKLRAIVRMGVGYDRIDRKAAAARNITVCNVPDYGTTEVADHAMALVLALRRAIILHYERQRASPPAPWRTIDTPLLRRLGALTFGVLGIGRIGTAFALRAKAFGARVIAYDPYQPNGVERGIGIERARSLDELLRQAEVLSVHAPLTAETRGLLGQQALALLPRGAVLVNTARGGIVDIEAVERLLRDGHLAGVGLDVLPEEPPADPGPALLRAYRAREPWLEGRLIVTPHSAFHSPESWEDIRVKSAETMRAALLGPRPQNVITPDML
ncbi:MAG: C-terminal binding protein [Alphaproteobacteria bacterium]|nr:C-terminal binding protein [Alphaproteobacteria bacterium]